MRRHVKALLMVAASALLASCATDKMRSKETLLTDTLRSYASTIRWGAVENAQAFIDPKVLAEHPPSTLELERFKQVQITGYNEQPALPVGDNEVRQTVEISLVNVNTQAARSVIDRQTWRYDEEAKRWWLMTGLPVITQAQ
ncbi:hypothetical protein [Dokdonella sp.]|uniref:hypothetical protein n=1 Tax=Dokdonella sp. TaxID=2291710 RepID=UPI001B00FC49|nr:hypothetical protein [Dokdonella sp.]MBO9661375.1 hypothetical protein [Dokdonella sp.]